MAWKYAMRNLGARYHVNNWPMFEDWLNICKSGDTNSMSAFHNSFITDLNKRLKEESISTDPTKPYQYYDESMFSKYVVTFDYDPYIRFMTYSAREAITHNTSDEAIVWFSKQKLVEHKHIVYAINTLLITRQLNRARFVLSLFPTLSFAEEANHIGADIFREVLMTNDIPLIHELWLRGALNGERCYELCDAACEKGWVKEEALEWYKLHRDRKPEQKITGIYDYLQ